MKRIKGIKKIYLMVLFLGAFMSKNVLEKHNVTQNIVKAMESRPNIDNENKNYLSKSVSEFLKEKVGLDKNSIFVSKIYFFVLEQNVGALKEKAEDLKKESTYGKVVNDILEKISCFLDFFKNCLGECEKIITYLKNQYETSGYFEYEYLRKVYDVFSSMFVKEKAPSFVKEEAPSFVKEEAPSVEELPRHYILLPMSHLFKQIKDYVKELKKINFLEKVTYSYVYENIHKELEVVQTGSYFYDVLELVYQDLEKAQKDAKEIFYFE